MDYDLVRMGSTTFEQMAVALCGAELGPGGESFGRGKDGGREWTYTGHLPLPYDTGPETNWTGYTVAQAKHKSLGGIDEVTWLLNQIQQEVKDWVDEDSKRGRRPENLLIITNVNLSSVPTQGGKDRVSAKMRQHAETLKLKGWQVWSSTDISRLLDNHPGIRQTYLGVTTVGDLLTTLNEIYTTQKIDDFAALQNFVAKELGTQMNVRLTRAGDGPETEKISDIGVDLPSQKVVGNLPEDGTNPIGKVLIQAGNRVLKGSSTDNSSVIIGGPGQGKSTITQMICQAYRVAILKNSVDRQSKQTRQLIGALEDHFKTIGLELPVMHRWPIYIRLNQYSQELAGSKDVSILRYIAQIVTERTSTTITPQQLNSWLSKWPWVVVLDGLDEVPDASTRENLLEKIADFTTDVAQAGADVYILATTREQGYERDLTMLEPTEHKLASLDKDQALAYAARLVTARYPGDEDSAREVLKRLTRSAEDAATAALLNTPLQVSIMASLLRDQVKAPTTRHELFESYYDTVLRRESNKEGRLGEQMSTLSSEITAIHNSVGARLHSDAERAGNADIHISKSELTAIATTYLHEEQTYPRDEAVRLALSITSLTTDRLVLLVEAGADRWGYELRSFQEFTASRYLLAASDEVVVKRLERLAPSSHWRNVWLFAAAKIIKERSWLRPQVMGIISSLDEKDVVNQLTMPGARLAVDMLLYGVAANVPEIRRRLLNEAMRLLGRYGVQLGLIAALNEATQSDPVSINAVKDVLRNNLALGGPVRVRTIATMRVWADGDVGPIPAFCRQNLPQLEDTGSTDSQELSTPSFESVTSLLSEHYETVERLLASTTDVEELDEVDAELLEEFKDGLGQATTMRNRGADGTSDLILFSPPALSASLLEKISDSTVMLRIADVARVSPESEVVVSDVITMEFLQLVAHRVTDKSDLGFRF